MTHLDFATNSRVAFVIPYFGKWPFWLPLFLKSCEANPCISALFISPQKPPWPLPVNARFVEMSRRDVLARLSNTTGLKLNDMTGHKLCDFKPFFGLAFSNLIAGHEFWGFCDIDIMFGDLGKLLTEDFFRTVDVFTAHNVQFAGHFTVLRNTPIINEACFRMEDWERMCLEPTLHLVDEAALPAAIEKNPAIRLLRPGSMRDELSLPFGRIGITFDFNCNVAWLEPPTPGIARWENGRASYTTLSGKTTEVLYLHFMGLKRWWHWCLFTKSAVARPSHIFSRIGYGGVTRPGDLDRPAWKLWFFLQSMMMNAKSRSGTFLRALLPRSTFARIRRLVAGKDR